MTQNSTPTPSQPEQTAGQRGSGMNCPKCMKFIPLSIFQLLYEGGVTCPHCGLTMTIDKLQSSPALEAFKKLEEATKKLRETKSFKR